MPKFSIVTIVKGRRKQLTNLLQSIKLSTLVPFDVQVVCMDNLDGILTPVDLNVNIQLVADRHELPLAAARNAGISAAKTENIIFIDVDCIVSPTLFATMLKHLRSENIITAYPLYLPLVPDKGDYPGLKGLAITHPAREYIPVGEPVDHLQFWSLIFAVQKRTFEDVGGFDESFTGYGAEDTDFAMSFNRAGIKLIFSQDHVLHQYHEKHDPPLNHFDSIVDNALRYFQKWGVLPMRSWLNAFQGMKLIKIDLTGKIIVCQKPTNDQINKSVSKNSY